jgi:methylenetetrahydrofolate dehydrogenase (NADP+)/methenyltetrahydrofolate cyclohydrolase
MHTASYTLLDGKALAKKMIAQAKQKVSELETSIKLVVLMVGNDAASEVYVRNKEKACKEAGVISEKILLPTGTTQKEIIEKIKELNADPEVTGMIVQLPLPDHFYVPDIIRAIDPKKDVDGFHAYNLGKMFLSSEFEDLPPATPAGILRLLQEYTIDVKGMNAVVIGHSNIVGKPMSVMLLNRGATVTTCHIDTKDVGLFTRSADIIVVAVGKPNILTGDMVRDGAIIIDVGINRLEDGTLVGDVDFASVSQKAGYITPVPGGVGPVTVAQLIINTVHAKERQQ